MNFYWKIILLKPQFELPKDYRFVSYTDNDRDENNKITERKVKSLKEHQLSIFDLERGGESANSPVIGNLTHIVPFYWNPRLSGTWRPRNSAIQSRYVHLTRRIHQNIQKQKSIQG